MRDIRSDLIERLEVVRSQKQRLLEQTRVLEAEESNLRMLLDIENHRFAATEPSLFKATVEADAMPERTGGPIRAFIEDALSDGRQISLEALTSLARSRGLEVPGKSLGRTLHAALLGMSRLNLAENVDRGVWRLTNRNAPPAQAGGASH